MAQSLHPTQKRRSGAPAPKSAGLLQEEAQHRLWLDLHARALQAVAAEGFADPLGPHIAAEILRIADGGVRVARALGDEAVLKQAKRLRRMLRVLDDIGELGDTGELVELDDLVVVDPLQWGEQLALALSGSRDADGFRARQAVLRSQPAPAPGGAAEVLGAVFAAGAAAPRA